MTDTPSVEPRRPNPESVRRLVAHMWGRDIVDIRAAIESFGNGWTVVEKAEAAAPQPADKESDMDYNHIRDDVETGFHVQDGLFFKRLPDGSVRVTLTEVIPTRGGDFAVRTAFQTTINANSWASVIASVSARGENTYDDFQRAVDFHGQE